MILFCELSFNDGTHAPFNAGLLATAEMAFPTESLWFFGAAAHIDALKGQVGSALAEAITWIVIEPPAPGTPYLRRFSRELTIVRRVMRASVSDPRSRIVFTSAYPSTVMALKTARPFIARSVPVQVVLHGLSGVVGKRYRHPIRRLQDMKTALMLFGNRGIQYIVLEQAVHDRIKTNVPALAKNFQTFDHPIAPDEGGTATGDISEPIRFGFLGLALASKGFPLFVELANEVGKRYGRRVEFHAIGRFPEQATPMAGTEVLTTAPRTGSSLSRAEFIRGVMPLHFIFLLHEANSYSMTASGVLLDAIAWGKPVIARNIPIFHGMFKKYGDIGYLFNNEAHLRSLVDQVMQDTDRNRYRRQVVNLRSARESRSPASLAAPYRAMCATTNGASE